MVPHISTLSRAYIVVARGPRSFALDQPYGSCLILPPSLLTYIANSQTIGPVWLIWNSEGCLMSHFGTPASWTEETPVERSKNPSTVPYNHLNLFLFPLVNQHSAVRLCETRRRFSQCADWPNPSISGVAPLVLIFRSRIWGPAKLNSIICSSYKSLERRQKLGKRKENR
jgi:hypothetical protein